MQASSCCCCCWKRAFVTRHLAYIQKGKSGDGWKWSATTFSARDRCENMRKWVTAGRIPHGDEFEIFILFFKSFRCADCYVCVLSFARFSWLAPVLGLPRGEKQRPIERENIEPQSIRVHLGEDKAIIANWMICNHLEPLFILLFSPEISLTSW